ncbi:MAG: Rieske 2Fe-2S domain-containing protein [Chloroflexi bacterium]|nr:Rieske 2Fe-2S domain-containing protein [Chloroflexota bacterium]
MAITSIEAGHITDGASGRAPWTDFAHTESGTLAGRYLRSFWQPIWYSTDIKAGHTKPLRVMSEDFTLYRGESGQVHLLAFRCAHRGTQLSTGWVEGDNLRCFYHGWMYDGSGQCVEQPAEPQPFCARIRIRSYPVQEYLGLVFAYLGEGDPSELPRYREFEGDDVVLSAGGGDGEDSIGSAASDLDEPLYHDYPAYRPCNYFNTARELARSGPPGVCPSPVRIHRQRPGRNPNAVRRGNGLRFHHPGHSAGRRCTHHALAHAKRHPAPGVRGRQQPYVAATH